MRSGNGSRASSEGFESRGVQRLSQRTEIAELLLKRAEIVCHCALLCPWTRRVYRPTTQEDTDLRDRQIFTNLYRTVYRPWLYANTRVVT